MVAGRFDTLLQEMGAALEVEDLSLDENRTCLVHFANGLEIFFEPGEDEEELLILAKLGELQPGIYKEEVLREAMKANGYPFPRYGTFAFSTQNNNLILFKLLPIKDLNGERVASYLGSFMTRAQSWKEAIDSGQVPLAATLATSGRRGGVIPKGMFGGLTP